jgi:hypothetical protein
VRVTIAREGEEVILMKGRRHTPEQIVRKLREADRLLAEGADLDAVCRHLEVLRDYESILAKLAIDHADLELPAFEPPDGTALLRAFIDSRWHDAAARTRKKVRAVLMSFFKWAQAEFKLHGNPVVPIRTPRLRDVERDLFSTEDTARIINAQAELRDRVALKLLFLMALRKGGLASIRGFGTSIWPGGGSVSTRREARFAMPRSRPRTYGRRLQSYLSAAILRNTFFIR